ncbi:MAG TPA: amidohydrolase family protein [Pseudonocardia sp.]|nr:amidohydrolase family protein [Pseudonocardia sp.]
MATTAVPRAHRTVVRGARLFDGAGPVPLPSPTVVMDGSRIMAVGVPVPEHAEVVDLPGATLLPGLVDTHVHLAFDASTDPVGALAARDDEAALAAMTDAGRTAARAGVTTVRDLGDRRFLALDLRDRAEPGLPTIVASGPPLTTPGGHCHYLGGESTDVRATIRAHAERGVDVIKIMASGGNLTPGSRPEIGQFEPDELRAAVDEAHRLGLPVTAHVHGTQAVVDAVAAGVDGLEHVTFMTADGVDPIPRDLLPEIVARRIVLGLTVGAVPGATVLAPMAMRMPALLANARLLCASGATVTAGTDGGVSPGKPHDVLPYAIAELVRRGMSPTGALVAATSRAAEVCRLGDRKGRLAPGFDADVLAVDGDPLTEPSALRRVLAVFVRGLRVR